jgi:hypothetical protein
MIIVVHGETFHVPLLYILILSNQSLRLVIIFSLQETVFLLRIHPDCL